MSVVTMKTHPPQLKYTVSDLELLLGCYSPNTSTPPTLPKLTKRANITIVDTQLQTPVLLVTAKPKRTSRRVKRALFQTDLLVFLTQRSTFTLTKPLPRIKSWGAYVKDISVLVSRQNLHPQLSLLEPPQPVHVFLDHSNILHGGSRLLKSVFASLPNGQAVRDAPISLNPTRLNHLLQQVIIPYVSNYKSTKIDNCIAVASNCTINNKVQTTSASKLSQLGWTVHVLERSTVGREVFNDELLHLHMSESIMEHTLNPNGPSPIMVLFTGDGRPALHTNGFPFQIARALRFGWTVAVVSFSFQLSSIYLQMVKVMLSMDQQNCRMGKLYVIALDGEVASLMQF